MILKTRPLYSERNNLRPTPQVTFDVVRKLCWAEVEGFSLRGYFKQALGYRENSVVGESYFVVGTLGRDPGTVIAHRLQNEKLWPMENHFFEYEQAEMFDVIEMLYDFVSKPRREGMFLIIDFNARDGKREFRSAINAIIEDFDFELSVDGEILAKLPNGVEAELKVPNTMIDPNNIEQRRDLAVRKFRRHNASMEEQREAIRQLADVFEFIRPKLAGILAKKDENDIFRIANEFGIRHHNSDQKTDYDPEWYNWIFIHFLSTLNFALARIANAGATKTGRVAP